MGNDQLLPAYNLQTAVCDEYIAVVDVKPYASDMECFVPLMEKYHKIYGHYPKYPVADAGFSLSLSPKLRAKAFSDIELLRNMGNELREPYVKPIKGEKNKGLYELRVKFSNDIVRIFYFTYHNKKYILLHGFIKKSIKTPQTEIGRARKYMEDYVRRCKQWAK
ncbi:type II toxin-antitoxin system RelE/ParE family toxin [Lachnoclostridium pacaense]|nr:type II toxin-antitoxin system RelE/ParE family toxin [Lachnoclostridium pacaense]MCC2877866.1 type II toxin-antitoxin system RelE/ParE family toxin [Lachnoclostridium pacaense]